jgi:hypothetical protein
MLATALLLLVCLILILVAAAFAVGAALRPEVLPGVVRIRNLGPAVRAATVEVTSDGLTHRLALPRIGRGVTDLRWDAFTPPIAGEPASKSVSVHARWLGVTYSWHLARADFGSAGAGPAHPGAGLCRADGPGGDAR